MEALKRVRFFRNNPTFAVTSPDPFAYGGGALIEPELDRISWCDARYHEINVARVGTNTDRKLVVVDRLGRKFAFEPMTVAFWNLRFPERRATTVAEIEKILAEDRPG